MKEITKLEWSILNCLSDDEETTGLIFSMIKDDLPNISIKEVAESILKLYQKDLLLEDNHQDVVPHNLIMEGVDYRDNVYWFGLTDKGCKYWEEYAPTYSGGPIDWSQCWVGHLDYEHKNGHVDGISLKGCLQGLKRIDTEKDWQVDRTTLTTLVIAGFQATYYKYIKGGCRVSFKLKKRRSKNPGSSQD
jgi:hypothetical protein